MRKVLAVARTEYLNAVRSKAFIIGLLLMPVLMGGAIVVNEFLEDRVDVEDRKIAVLDHTGGHKAQAAKILGISRKNLWEKMRDYDVE